MNEVLLMGEPMAMFVSERTCALEDADVFRRFLAGAEVNVAIGLSKLEHSVFYATRLGRDPFGKYGA